jgi:hypothetical protein
MQKVKRSISTLRAHPVSVLALAAVLMVGVGVAAVAVASKGSSSHRHSGLAVFHRRIALKANVASTSEVPPGAIRVAVDKGDEVYVWHPTAAEEPQGLKRKGTPGGKICLIQVNGEYGTESCSPAGDVEGKGAVSILGFNGSPSNVAALVPNAVRSIVATDLNGEQHDVPAINDVAVVEASKLATISYTLPGGSVHTINVQEGS